jgi:uncharacterized protein YjbI with pentapeptide repeats
MDYRTDSHRERDPRLDKPRQIRVIRFLSDAQLIRRSFHLVDLRRLDLSDTNLGSLDLVEVDLTEANLRGVKFFGSDLTKANLRGKPHTMISKYHAAAGKTCSFKTRNNATA